MNIVEALSTLDVNKQGVVVSRRSWTNPDKKHALLWGKAVQIGKKKDGDRGTLYYKYGIGGMLRFEAATFDEHDVLADDWYVITNIEEWTKQQLQ